MSKIGLVYSANEDLFSIAIVVGMTFTSVIAVNAKTGDLWLYEELCMRLSIESTSYRTYHVASSTCIQVAVAHKDLGGFIERDR